MWYRTIPLVAVIVWVWLGLPQTTVATGYPCALRQYSSGSVCVCNVTYCDTLEFEDPTVPGSFVLVSSSSGGLRFALTKGSFLRTKGGPSSPPPPRKRSRATENDITITIDRTRRYQTVEGFGGAFTGAVSYNLAKLRAPLRESLYKSYYSKEVGIGYSFMRIPIGGCDFDLDPWAYNELPTNDGALSNFTTLDDRDLVKVSQIKQLMEVTNNSDIRVIGAAWSPPRWMKTNNDWTGASRLKPEYYQAWADYHVRYLELMKAAGLEFWAISTGNEPLNGVIGFLFIHFMSLGWTAPEQGRWVGQYLGPTLRKSSVSSVKLFGCDDQRYTFPWWFKLMDQGHANATSYLDGLAVHWYWDGVAPPALLDQTATSYPGKWIFNTEASLGDKPLQQHRPILGSWERAESYILYVLQDLQHSVNGWIDWNLVLDERGGPNYAKNYVESAVIANITSKEEAYKQPIFYGLGHFSRFILPGSVRLDAQSASSNVVALAFERLDNKTVVVFYNKANTQSIVRIEDKRYGSIRLQLPGKSVHSFLYA
ncbi:lysosomal acid glucosylceramidase-like [Anopheles ziemanni]|uniref:lysosomal acid glucosylceramidase-like n=1 Tax=Anopheles coustani TaxID=139045 RepID=UPI002658D66E|nr:lysosomal acid glucosylceramidase-like [Anopheles coustani]XP_058169175.1 lysosomal acid glucosylceramidase-like [Anopheles ziemanni]